MHQHYLALALVCSLVPTGARADWPQFRGPTGQGIAKVDRVLPNWSESDSIAWKTPIPGQGFSSPVIRGNQIWMTSSTGNGKSLRAVCVDREKGTLLHDIEVVRPAEAGSKHTQNGFASPTPVLDGDHIYVHFGGKGTACLSRKGELVWKNTELPFSAVQGSASSPVLHGNLLILTCDGNDAQFLAALDKTTGKVVWKTPRKHLDALAKTNDLFKMSYSTPLVVRVGNSDQLVSTAADHVAAYDVASGAEIWWMPYEGCSLVARPSFGHGLIFVVGSVKLDDHCLYAIRPGRGKIEPSALAWQRREGVGHVPSPLLVGKELYLLHDSGVVTCLDALTGKEHWSERLRGRHRASPVEVNGRIYLSNEEGTTTVLAAEKQFKKLASNQLDGALLASPAIADNALFLRSATHLYRIE